MPEALSDLFSDTHLTALLGLFGGVLLGLTARLGRFCTLGAIEDLLYGGSSLRMRMWGMAIGMAILGSFGLIALGWFDPVQSQYLAIRWMPLASITGGLLFGYGMALSGMCGYGAIARLGGGDLRSFVIVLVMGVSTFVALSGPLAPFRNLIFFQDPITDDLPAGIAHHLADQLGLAITPIGFAIGGAILLFSILGREVREARAAVGWAALVAIAIVSGWAGSSYIARTGFDAVPVVSHSFSAPLGETIMWTMTGSLRPISFAVGSVSGVWLGAFIGSLIKGHFRWEACDDPRELRRQIIGAAIMGTGAVLAMGCTIGQGLSAFSLLSLSAPVTFLSIFAGAALGLRQLITGFRRAA
ncbi:YeeE/YedE family protein [Phaeobacter inhibens]|uniref:YeeE/YedE family protein n=1 Tax=Phaeobacter inhibens TaxID=221822 RepID=UPI0021A7F51E|nr:YeeE/YedE family protein [Phaeobacter inhibens]UWR93624.1 YeeE/YedE family protein [Phaeobacter inhibens]